MKLRIKTEKNLEKDSTNESIYHSLLNLAELLNQQVDFDEMLRIIGLQARQLFQSDYSSIVMINPKTQENH